MGSFTGMGLINRMDNLNGHLSVPLSTIDVFYWVLVAKGCLRRRLV